MMVISSLAVLSVGSAHCDNLTVRVKTGVEWNHQGKRHSLPPLGFVPRSYSEFYCTIMQLFSLLNFLCFILLVSQNTEGY